MIDPSISIFNFAQGGLNWVVTNDQNSVVISSQDLMDANLPREEAYMCELIRSFYPGIRGFHYLRSRKAGHLRFVEFHIQVDSEMSVNDSHRLAQGLSHKFKQEFPDSTATIHIEPCTGECIGKCLYAVRR